jgi:hypothetical protein
MTITMTTRRDEAWEARRVEALDVNGAWVTAVLKTPRGGRARLALRAFDSRHEGFTPSLPWAQERWYDAAHERFMAAVRELEDAAEALVGEIPLEDVAPEAELGGVGR